MSDKYVCRSIRLMPSRRLAGIDAKLAWLDLGRDSGPVGMSQACPSASIAGPLQQAMESTGVNNQVALEHFHLRYIVNSAVMEQAWAFCGVIWGKSSAMA